MIRRMFSVVLAIVLVAAVPLVAGAQQVQAVVIGTFNWQLQPYCSTLTLTVLQEAGRYRLQGTEACASGIYGSVHGTAAIDSQGGILLTVNTPAGGDVVGTLSLSTLSGTWTDERGRSGAMVLVSSPASTGQRRIDVNGNAFLHIASAANVTGGVSNNVTCFSHPFTDGNPAAIIQVSVNRGPANAIRPLVGSDVSLYYDNNGTGLPAPLSNNVWCISKDDSLDMPLGAAFNIRIDVP